VFQTKTLGLVCFSVFKFAQSQSVTTTTLTPSPSPSVLGEAVTLTATVSPGATGQVTFYDGTTVLGASGLSGGQATLSTILLPPGTRTLQAFYAGDGSHAASTSAAALQTVTTLPSLGVKPARNYGVGAAPIAAVAGDMNGDGKQDLVVVNSQGTVISILLGTGNGSFLPALNYAVPACVSCFTRINKL
jgi:hypothetical protein